MNVRIKGKDGIHIRGKVEVKGVWKSHFEHLTNEKTERKATVSSMGVKEGGQHENVQERINRKEVKNTIDKLKCGKAANSWNNCRNVKI